jgi:hypothetical protein
MAVGGEVQRAALGVGTRYPAPAEVNPDDLRVRKAGVDITDECRIYTHRERTHTLHLLYHNGGIASSWVEGYKIEVLDGKA